MMLPGNLYEKEAVRSVTGPAIRPGGMALTERAMAFCRLPQGARALDVGCGAGATVGFLRQNGLSVAGVDLSFKLLKEGRATTGKGPLILGCAERLPIASGSVAAIFCECVLSLLAAPEIALAEFSRVLADEGHLIITDLYARLSSEQGEKKSIPVRCCLDGAVDRTAMFDRMIAAGFQVLLFEDHTPLLKRLAAQLVWAHGSLADFWSAAGFSCRNLVTDAAGRPGYYLMVARKKGDACG